MTEAMETTTKACITGTSTERPCRWPATEPMPHWRDETPMLCAFHAALEPLAEERNALGIGLELFDNWEADARAHDNAPLLELLDNARAEFSGRLERADKVLDDLRAAEFRLMRFERG